MIHNIWILKDLRKNVEQLVLILYAFVERSKRLLFGQYV